MQIKNNAKVAFVILHYLVLDVTVRCIESIQNLLTYNEYQIVVVDNGSNNGSGEKLTELYKNEEITNVYLIYEQTHRSRSQLRDCCLSFILHAAIRTQTLYVAGSEFKS